MGAERAEAQEPQGGEAEWLGEKPWEAAAEPEYYEEAAEPRPAGALILAGLLILLALGLARGGRLCGLARPGPGRACRPGPAGRRRRARP